MFATITQVKPYDDFVLVNLEEFPDGATIVQVTEKVGDSSENVQECLQHLMEAGFVATIGDLFIETKKGADYADQNILGG